jgi:hypothetical protein
VVTEIVLEKKNRTVFLCFNIFPLYLGIISLLMLKKLNWLCVWSDHVWMTGCTASACCELCIFAPFPLVCTTLALLYSSSSPILIRSEQTRVVLTSAAYVHLKQAEISKYTRNLAPASRAILLSGPAGTVSSSIGTRSDSLFMHHWTKTQGPVLKSSTSRCLPERLPTIFKRSCCC